MTILILNRLADKPIAGRGLLGIGLGVSSQDWVGVLSDISADEDRGTWAVGMSGMKRRG